MSAEGVVLDIKFLLFNSLSSAVLSCFCESTSKKKWGQVIL